MVNNDLLKLPLYLVGIFWLAGLLGTWRRAVTCLIFSYVALIVACQHNAFVADMGLMSALAGQASPIQKSALGFALSLVIVFIVLFILFRIMWVPTQQPSQSQGTINKLGQSILTGIAGWALGVMLAFSLVTHQVGRIVFLEGGAETVFYNDAMSDTTNAVITLIDPWLPDDLPLFLREWKSGAQ